MPLTPSRNTRRSSDHLQYSLSHIVTVFRFKDIGEIDAYIIDIYFTLTHSATINNVAEQSLNAVNTNNQFYILTDYDVVNQIYIGVNKSSCELNTDIILKNNNSLLLYQERN